MRLAIVTLNYNGAQSTIKLLASLQNQTDPDSSLIIADNGSDDLQELRDYCTVKPIHLIENGINLGFAGGNNRALDYVFKNGHDWAVLLNNDTWVEPDFVERLKANLSGKEGLVGLPLKEDGLIAYAGHIRWLKPTLKHIYHQLRPPNKNIYPIGGGMAISKKAYAQLGGLDENYFLYFEDADYTIAARGGGVRVEFINEPAIYHSVSSTTKKLGPPVLLRYHYRNALYFNFKNGPWFIKILAIPWSVLVFLKQIFKILNDDHPAESKAIMNGVADFYQERMGYISAKIKVGIECEQIEGEIWGVGRVITKLLENIASRPELEKNFEFHLYFKSTIPDLPFLDNKIFHKEIIYQPFKHKSFVLYYYLLLPIRLWFARLDVAFFPNYMLPIIFLGNSTVMLTEDIYYEMSSSEQLFRHRLAYWVFGNWAAWHANKIMAISENSKKELVQLFAIEPERIFVNYLGIDLEKTNSNSKTENYILFVGQAFPRRHLAESLLAFEKIASDFPDLKFIAVGPDKYNPPKIKSLVKAINSRLGEERVIYYERVSSQELASLYTHAQTTVYISSREAFGLPPLEALAHGSVPIIADNPLSHEVFADNAIFVHDINSSDAIAGALREAMTNSMRREKILKHAPEITRRFTWPAHTDRFMEMIRLMTRYD
jgi:hypothetical protein